eukprot:917447-Prorocentrum_minimum.AAC.1
MGPTQWERSALAIRYESIKVCPLLLLLIKGAYGGLRWLQKALRRPRGVEVLVRVIVRGSLQWILFFSVCSLTRVHPHGPVDGLVELVVDALAGAHVVASVQVVAVAERNVRVRLDDAHKVQPVARHRRLPRPPAVVLRAEEGFVGSDKPLIRRVTTAEFNSW